MLSAELKLTALLSELFDYLEAQSPQLLMYDNVSFRRAMESYFYFEALIRPSSISPIITLTKNWREEQGNNSELAKLYDFFSQKIEHLSLLDKLKVRLLPWGRLAKDVLSAFIYSTTIQSKRLVTRKYGFFAINQRFMDFFEPVQSQLGEKNTVCFSPKRGLHGDKQSLLSVFKMLILSAKTSASMANPGQPLFPIIYRQVFFYNHIHSSLSRHAPSTLVFAEGTSHYDYLTATAAKTLGIKTVRLQSGRAGILHSGYRNMNFDFMLCWSEDFVERYKDVSPLPNYYVVGSPVLDEYVNFQKGADRHIRNVLFITQPVSQHITESDYHDLIWVAKKLLKESARVKLIIRKHPVDQHEGFDLLCRTYPDRVKQMNSPEHSLAEALSESASTVGFFSTALSESAACGVIPIILRTKDSQSVYPFPEKHNAAIVKTELASVVQEVLSVTHSPDKYKSMKLSMREFSQRFFGPADGQALHRIVSVIEDIAINPRAHVDG